MAGVSSISTSRGSIDVLVNQFLSAEKKPIDSYTPEKSSLNQKISVLTDLKTNLTNLNSIFDSFTTASRTNTLAAKAAVSSDEALFTAEADSTAVSGVYSVKINQLAKNDTAVSDRFDASAKTLSSLLKNKVLTFKVGTGSDTPTTFSIDIDETGLTDEEVLRAVAGEINGAGIRVSATVIKDTPDTVRLTLISKDAGSSNALELQDVGSAKILQNLGFIRAFNDRPDIINSHGGFVNPDSDDLNAKFSINGISIVGDSNTVTDVLQGVTITLRKAQESDAVPETVTISGSSEDVVTQVNKFVEDYNKVIDFINSKTRIDSTTLERGALTGNSTVRNLLLNLRSLISSSVSTAKSGNPKTLREIGIGINNDGTLEVEDKDKLESVIESGNDKVTDIFNSASGLAVRGKDILRNYISTGGAIDSLKKGTQSRITGVESNISRIENRLQYRESALRDKFSELQKSLSKLNTQSSLLQRIFGSSSQSNYSSLIQSSLF